MAQKILGVDLGTHSVKIAVASATFRGISIDSSERALVQREEGQSNLEAAISTACGMIQARGWEDITAAVSVPAGTVSYRSLHFPFSDAKRIAQTLIFELDGKFAQPTDELVVDHVPAVAGDGSGLGVVAAQPVTQAEAVKDRFKAYGVDVRVVTCGAFALGQIAPSLGVAKYEGDLPDNTKAVSLVMDVGHRATEIAVLSGTQIVGARSFRVGAQSIRRVLAKHEDVPDLAKVQLQDPLTPAQAAALSPLAREVERLMHWLESECSFQVTELLLAGAVSRMPGLDLWLASELARPCRVIPFTDTKAVKRIESRADDLSWAAIGAAHAGLRRSLIDLQSQSDAADDESDLIKRRLVSVAVVGVCVLACAGIDTLAKVRAESRQRDAYRQELELFSQGVFGAKVSSLDGVKTLLIGDESNLMDKVPSKGALDVWAMITKAASPSDADSAGGPGQDGGAGDDAGSDGAMPGSPGSPGRPLGLPGSARPDKPGGSKGGSLLGGLGSKFGLGGAKPDADGEGGEDEQVLSVVPVDAGIVSDDRLYMREVDIHERKIVLQVAAMRGSAKDRLKRKLSTIPCMKNITTGPTRDFNEFKQFEMTIDHNCYFYKPEAGESESED